MNRLQDKFFDLTPHCMELRGHLSHLRASLLHKGPILREEPIEFPPGPHELPRVTGIGILLRPKFDLVARVSLAKLKAELVGPHCRGDEAPYVVALGEIELSIEAFRKRALTIEGLSEIVAALQYGGAGFKALEQRAVSLLIDHHLWDYEQRAWGLFIEYEAALARRDLDWRRSVNGSASS